MSERNPNMKYVRRHYHQSPKAGIIFCCSSYELKMCLILDFDDSVAYYQTQIPFEIEGRKRKLDFLVCYKDGKKKVIEIKPLRRVNFFKQQIDDNKIHALNNGYDFALWTESNLGFTNGHDAQKWADKYISERDGINYVAIRKQRNIERSMRHYRKHIATDTIDVFCPFCNAAHTALKLTYEKNIARNGRYICEKEGGHIAGSKPKKKKDNPYAAEGKKQCNQCKEIKLFENFGIDKLKSDGYATRCKQCRCKSAKEKYHGIIT